MCYLYTVVKTPNMFPCKVATAFLSTNLERQKREIDALLIVAIARGVIEPWVVDRAPDACLQIDGLAGNLL
jgi:hypothetical protein